MFARIPALALPRIAHFSISGRQMTSQCSHSLAMLMTWRSQSKTCAQTHSHLRCWMMNLLAWLHFTCCLLNVPPLPIPSCYFPHWTGQNCWKPLQTTTQHSHRLSKTMLHLHLPPHQLASLLPSHLMVVNSVRHSTSPPMGIFSLDSHTCTLQVLVFMDTSICGYRYLWVQVYLWYSSVNVI